MRNVNVPAKRFASLSNGGTNCLNSAPRFPAYNYNTIITINKEIFVLNKTQLKRESYRARIQRVDPSKHSNKFFGAYQHTSTTMSLLVAVAAELVGVLLHVVALFFQSERTEIRGAQHRRRLVRVHLQEHKRK